MIGGIIIAMASSSTVIKTIKINVVQIIEFTIVEYLKEVNINEFFFSILSNAIIPPIQSAIKNEITSPSSGFP